jgi:hypothetical protein
MTTLTARIVTANFTTEDGGKNYSYPVYVFKNGLVLVPSDTTHDWFFRSEDEIEGCGDDWFTGVEDTDRTVEFTKKELADSWGNSVREFQDKTCVKLVNHLLTR